MKFLLMFVAVILSVSSFSVKAAEGEPWNIRCQGEGKAKQCEMFQKMTVIKTGQRVLEFSIGKADKRGVSTVAIIMPLGILVQDKIFIVIDDKQPVLFKIAYCLPEGCIGRTKFGKEVIANMKRGGNIAIKSRSADGKPVNISLSLKGFTKKSKMLNR